MSEYDEQAQRFLEDTHTEIKIRKTGVVQGFPFGEDNLIHDRYSVTLTRENGKYKFAFYDSWHNHIKGKRPTAYDILSCVQSFPVSDDMWDFAAEYGYEVKDKESYNRLEKTWKACRKEYESLLKLFGSVLLERLSEIR